MKLPDKNLVLLKYGLYLHLYKLYDSSKDNQEIFFLKEIFRSIVTWGVRVM